KAKLEDEAPYQELHERACQFFEDRRQSPDTTLEEQEKCKLERLYHEFQLAQARGLKFFRSSFEEAFRPRQFDFCGALINELTGYDLEENTRWWARYYEGLMAVYLGTDRDRSLQIFEELRSKRILDRELRLSVLEQLASNYWYYYLREEKATDQAESLYKEVLNLRSADPKDKLGQARA